MTDRYTGFVVCLENDMRDDDAQAIITAIETLRGVASVQPVVADIDSFLARESARMDLVRQLTAVLMPKAAS